MDPSLYRSETFTPHISSVFHSRRDDGQDLQFVLAEVTPGHADSRTISFSLIFRAPMSPALQQQIIRMEHDALGELELFLVPIGADGDHMLYQAVFSRLTGEPGISA